MASGANISPLVRLIARLLVEDFRAGRLGNFPGTEELCYHMCHETEQQAAAQARNDHDLSRPRTGRRAAVSTRANQGADSGTHP